MNEMNITAAQYHQVDGRNDSIVATISGEQLHVPLEVGNRHYDEIMRQVAAGDLTIADAD